MFKERIEIKPNDLISGAMYLKLIRAYKEHEQKLRNRLAEMQKKMDFLEWENEDLRLALEESECKSTEKLRTKLNNQRVTINKYSEKNYILKEEIAKLTLKIESLTQELNALKQANPPKNQEASEDLLIPDNVD